VLHKHVDGNPTLARMLELLLHDQRSGWRRPPTT
jgi:hypothetical protein